MLRARTKGAEPNGPERVTQRTALEHPCPEEEQYLNCLAAVGDGKGHVVEPSKDLDETVWEATHEEDILQPLLGHMRERRQDVQFLFDRPVPS